MRIDSYTPISRVESVRQKSVRGARSVDAPASDSVDISASSADISLVMEALQGAPDVREDRVAELRAQVEQGRFAVPARDLADKLLGSGGSAK